MIEIEDVEKYLKDIGVEYRLVRHKAVFTVEESLAELEDKQPIKNLFLTNKNKSAWYLVIAKGNERTDLAQLASELGEKKLRFASPDDLMKYLGVTPGSVSIFCLLEDSAKDVKLVLDQSMMDDYAELGFHPCDNTATIFLKMNDFREIVDSLDNQTIQV